MIANNELIINFKCSNNNLQQCAVITLFQTMFGIDIFIFIIWCETAVQFFKYLGYIIYAMGSMILQQWCPSIQMCSNETVTDRLSIIECTTQNLNMRCQNATHSEYTKRYDCRCQLKLPG